jgi:PAS domain S-box-containing protein
MIERAIATGMVDYVLPVREIPGALLEYVQQSSLKVTNADITEKKQAEEALRETAGRLQAVVDTAVDGIITIAEDGMIETFNSAAERIFGHTSAEAVGRNVNLLMPEPYHAQHDSYLSNYLRTGERKIIGIGREVKGLRKDGTIFPLELAVSETRLGDRRIFTGLIRDITNRKQAESRLAAEHAVTRVLAESRTVAEASVKILQTIGETLEWEFGALWTVDHDARALRCMKTWHLASKHFPEFDAISHQLTFSPGIGLVGRIWASKEPAWVPDVVNDNNFPRAPIAAKENLHGAFGFPICVRHEVSGVMEFFSHEIRQPDEALLKMVDAVGTEIGQFIERLRAEEALHETKDQLAKANEELERRVQQRTAELEQANRALLRDMEERKRLEEQFRQAQKMESIGTLAAGVAHDFNNILNIIHGYASLLSPHAAENEEIAGSLNVINEEVKRGATLVQQLLTIGRKTEKKVESTNVNMLLVELSRLLQQTFPKTIEVTLELNPDLPTIMADPNEITQALLNLCVNARDAMPDGGRLTLKTGAVEGKSLQDYAGAKSDGYVCIEVTDTGTGIDESVQSQIFEPFFTTKQTGKGTGLGLAVVYGIVQTHNGFIQLESKPMRGATFRIYLPVAPSEEKPVSSK